MLYQRYGNPKELLQQMIETGQFSETVDEILKITNEEKMWDFYLHKVEENISFDDFKAKIQKPEPAAVSADNLKETVRFSFEILENFHPENAKS